jgi:Putative DNA-binding domain
MLDLKKKTDLQRLVDEGLEESLTLDYKASPSLSRDGKNPEELCKDVSALANSAGGQLIYGIEEDKANGKPSKVDDGVSDPKITKEWIEQILNSKVQPRMDGVRIERIDMETGKFGYVISVHQSQTGPHQAPDGKYYKRFNFQSVPMHDYEIRDILRRSTTPNLDVKLSLPTGMKHRLEFSPHQDYSKSFLLGVTVSNSSPTPAYHAIVEVWVNDVLAVPFAVQFTQSHGTESPPGRRFKVMRWTLSSPPGIPIFEGANHESHFGQIPLQVPEALLQSSILYLETDVRAPGVSKHEKWAIHCEGGLLTLCDPKHPFVTTA